VLQEIIQFLGNVKYNNDDNEQENGNHKCGKKLLCDIPI
jgi:hypothetical protein